MQSTLSSIIKQNWYFFLPLYLLFYLIMKINNIFVQLLVYSISLVLLFIFLNKKFPSIFQDKHRPTLKNLIDVLAFRWLARVIAILSVLVINLFFPMTVVEPLDQFSLWQQFYLAVLVAPVVEEVYYRGIVLHRLLPFNISVAFLFNSLIFALPHLDFAFIINALLGGLLLSYAAYKYGIEWSILFHAVGNAFSIFSTYLIDHDRAILRVRSFNLTADTLMNSAIIIITIVSVVYFFVTVSKNRIMIRNLYTQYKLKPTQFIEMFKNPWVVFYMITNIIQNNFL